MIVPDHQLSLAIGREGQNARLAARLTGVRVDIRSETQLAEGIPAGGRDVEAVEYADGEWDANTETGEMEWHARRRQRDQRIGMAGPASRRGRRTSARPNRDAETTQRSLPRRPAKRPKQPRRLMTLRPTEVPAGPPPMTNRSQQLRRPRKTVRAIEARRPESVACLGCRCQRPQPELVRVTRATSDNGWPTLVVDGASSGRGAWLCRAAMGRESKAETDCLERALLQASVRPGMAHEARRSRPRSHSWPRFETTNNAPADRHSGEGMTTGKG